MRLAWAALATALMPMLAQAGPPPPASTSKADLLAWTNQHIRTDGWTLADVSTDGIWFVKPATVATAQRGRERVWLRIESLPTALTLPDNPYMGASRRTLLELDCIEWRYSILEAKRFTLNNFGGPSIDESGTGSWAYAPPNSAIDDILTFACPAK